ncbi:MAG: hypothetical protein BWY76_03079 [bacterium ADurb.Bin429]|nr:MAG: hypothetical protein BWY76_03079 [bacterium ADurb.Bin429]
MRLCPKCHAEYDDADLRTLCSVCMVGLVRVGDAPVEESALPAAPDPAPLVESEIITDARALDAPGSAMPEEPAFPLQAELGKPKYWIHGCLTLLTLAVGLTTISAFEILKSAIVVIPVLVVLLALLLRLVHSLFITRYVRLIPLATPMLDMTLPVRLECAFRQAIRLTAVEVSLTAVECAVRTNEDGETNFRQALYQHNAALEGESPARAFTFTADLPIPRNAPPTFEGHPNRIYWEIAVRIAMPGWLPAIRETFPIRVLPRRANDTALPAQTRQFPITALEGLPGTVTLDCPVSENGTPVVPIGRPIPFMLEITPDACVTNQRIRVELVYQVTGRGDAESDALASVIVFPEGWTRGARTATGTLLLPPTAPVSFTDQRMKIQWVLRVRHQVLWHRDYMQDFPIAVIPADSGVEFPPESEHNGGLAIFAEAAAFIMGRKPNA